jgi:hypothetical protein
MRKCYFVECSFPYKKSYGAKETSIEAIVGRMSDGGGSDFDTRDLIWEFKTLEDATVAFENLAYVKGLSNLNLSQEKY